MRVRREAGAGSIAAMLLLGACSAGDADLADPTAGDEPPWPADASVDDDVGPRPDVGRMIATDAPLGDVAPPVDVPPVDVPPALPTQRCRVESTTFGAPMLELDAAPTSAARLHFTMPGIPAGVGAAALVYDSFDADHLGEEGVISLNGRQFQMPADPSWDNVTVPGHRVDVTGAVAAGDNDVAFGPGPLARSFFRVGRVAVEFAARVARCPDAAVPVPMPVDAGAPAARAVERTIGYRAATYTRRGNWVFRCDANYAYTARGDHGAEDCTGGYAPDGTLRGTATFTFTGVSAATYDVLIGSRHSSNRNAMRALFTVNGEAGRIDQRTGDGALTIVTDLWGRRALGGTVTVVLDATVNSGSDSVSFVTLRPVR